jgi:hypothetical protein
MRSSTRLALVTGGVTLATAMVVSCARVQVPRPTSAEAPRSEFIQRGEHTFFQPLLLGEGGRTCASCHENHVPFEDYSLARRYDELTSLVEKCLYDEERAKATRERADAIEVRSLKEYVVYNYVLKGVIADENPEGIKKLGEGMEMFLRGDYDRALGEVRDARTLVKTPRNRVQSFALEGCIQLFKLNEPDAKRAFAEALTLDPKVRIDGYVFSPKVLRVLESTREEVDKAAAPAAP